MFDDIGSTVGSVLGGVGQVLDAPRRALYAGGNALYKGLTGDTGPDINDFGDILSRAGMDPDSAWTKALGVAGNVATDPLTWAGGLMGGAAAGALGVGADEALAAGRGAASLAEASPLKALMGNVTKFKDVFPAPADAIGEVLGNGFQRGAEAGELGGLVGSEAGGGYAGRVVGGKGFLPGQIEGKFDAAASELAAHPDFAGGYLPEQQATITPEGASPRVMRHENVHALIDQAAKNGTADQLPSSLMSVPARLKAAGGGDISTLAGGFGSVGDELAAQTLENRGLLGQLRGAGNFLFNPQTNGAYASLYSAKGVNPLAVAAYRAAGAAPYLAGGAGAGLLEQLGQR